MKYGGSGGGGGGKPYIRSSFMSYSTVCRPDPENPGHQICKNVRQESILDPETGKRSVRNVESEEQREIKGGFLGSFFGGGGDSGPPVH